MASLNSFIELMRYYCQDASVGYDQSQRWDVFDGGETDCSALVITCLKQAGFDTGNAITTHNMSSELCARGWTRLPARLSDAIPGDILLSDMYHVAVVVSGNGWSAKIAQASIDENGNASGGMAGDQTGWETNIRAIYDYPWDCILRYSDTVSGWIHDDNGWWYKNADGSWPADCWQWIKDAWYFFDANGYAVEGFQLWDGDFYYLEPGTCKMITGWKKVEGKWYWFANDGRMASNEFLKIDGKWYGFNRDGEMITKLNQLKISSQGAILFKEP